MIASALRGLLAAGAGLAMAASAAAQPLGAFRWQLSPFCNVVTLTVTQNGSIYRLEGFDDQCGAAQRGIITGLAVPNTDGTLEFGLTLVGATGAAPSHLGVSFSIPALGGPWRDSAGRGGTLVFNPGSVSGTPRPAGLGGVAIDPAQIQRRITGACPAGALMRSVAEPGTVTCGGDTAGPGEVTAVAAGAGLTGGGASGAVELAVAFGGTGAATSAARADHTHAAAGDFSLAIGDGASAGFGDTAIGAGALQVTQGSGHVAVGFRALLQHTTGIVNTAIGARSLESLTTGEENTAVGANALNQVVQGSESTAVGAFALFGLTTGTRNVAVGRSAMLGAGPGSLNTALGTEAMTNGGSNNGSVAVGANALHNNRGFANTAVGDRALIQVTTGGFNIAVGQSAGNGLVSGSDNIHLGAAAAAANEASTTRIGTGQNQTRTFIRGISGVTVSNAVPVLINILTGQLGTVVSSARFKDDIRPIDAEEARRLQSLRPVSFFYEPGHDSGARERQYGLIAEEVAETMPELVVSDEHGRPLTVKYHLLPPLLLAEAQRLEREGAEMRRTYDAALDALRKEIAALRAAMER